MKATFVGDIHGDFPFIEKICKEESSVIQVGDFGLGFPEVLNLATGLPFRKDPEKLPDNLYFIRGNHDDPAKCRTYSNYLGDYGYNEKLGIFFVSGAYSIDQEMRIQDVSWWTDEELSYIQFQDALDLYKKMKPKVVVAHTAPKAVVSQLGIPGFKWAKFGGRTEKAMDFMWQEHHPEIWCFGHWHASWNRVIQGTRFICLNINEVLTLDLPNTILN